MEKICFSFVLQTCGFSSCHQKIREKARAASTSECRHSEILVGLRLASRSRTEKATLPAPFCKVGTLQHYRLIIPCKFRPNVIHLTHLKLRIQCLWHDAVCVQGLKCTGTGLNVFHVWIVSGWASRVSPVSFTLVLSNIERCLPVEKGPAIATTTPGHHGHSSGNASGQSFWLLPLINRNEN